MDRIEAAKIMDVLKVAYPRFYAAQDKAHLASAVALWAEIFRPYPASLVAYAVKAYIASDSKGYPPAIGQVMDYVRMISEKPKVGESEAWSLVYKAICNSGYHAEEEFNKLPAEVRRVVGQPDQLRRWAVDPDFNPAVESSNFKRAYRSMAEQEQRYEALPADVKKYAVGLREALCISEEGA